MPQYFSLNPNLKAATIWWNSSLLEHCRSNMCLTWAAAFPSECESDETRLRWMGGREASTSWNGGWWRGTGDSHRVGVIMWCDEWIPKLDLQCGVTATISRPSQSHTHPQKKIKKKSKRCTWGGFPFGPTRCLSCSSSSYCFMQFAGLVTAFCICLSFARCRMSKQTRRMHEISHTAASQLLTIQKRSKSLSSAMRKKIVPNEKLSFMHGTMFVALSMGWKYSIQSGWNFSC